MLGERATGRASPRRLPGCIVSLLYFDNAVRILEERQLSLSLRSRIIGVADVGVARARVILRRFFRFPLVTGYKR